MVLGTRVAVRRLMQFHLTSSQSRRSSLELWHRLAYRFKLLAPPPDVPPQYDVFVPFSAKNQCPTVPKLSLGTPI